MTRRSRKPSYRRYVAGAEPAPTCPHLFGETTLPIFSGTAPPGKVEVFNAHTPAVHQDTFAACRFCHDTGITSAGFCTCEAGVLARQRPQP